jgi:hypothetical protein
MADIFVSYASADHARVAPIVRILESLGWSVWWDAKLSAGNEFDEVTLISSQSRNAYS